MEVSKLYAIILERLPDSNRSVNKVLGIRLHDGTLISDPVEIQKNFPPEGKVFTARTFEGVNDGILKIDDFIEIPVKEIHPKDGRFVRVDHLNITRKNASTIIEVPIECIDNNCIRPSLVEQFFLRKGIKIIISGDLYISISDYYYGPFRYSNGKIEPKTGKEVGKYLYNEDFLLEHGNISIMLDRPNDEIAKIDCMSAPQILDWVKEKIKGQSEFNGDINKIKTLLKNTITESAIMTELDQTRFERANTILGSLSLTCEEINLLRLDPRWKIVFDQSYEEQKEAFKKEYLKQLSDEFSAAAKVYESQLGELNKNVKSLSAKEAAGELLLVNIKSAIDKAQIELDHLISRRDELIVGVRLMAGITKEKEDINPQTQLVRSFELQTFETHATRKFSSLNEYCNELKNLLPISAADVRLFEDGLNVLFNRKFILGSNIYLTLCLIRSFGNATICIQQAEPDWMKFDRWIGNGLCQMIELALKESEKKHFYILQDYNMSAIECYGRPILDIASGLRQYVPGTSIPWPDNLQLILICVDPELGDLGLPINASTFKNWGILPYDLKFQSYKDFSLGSLIDREALGDEIDPAFNCDIGEYLN